MGAYFKDYLLYTLAYAVGFGVLFAPMLFAQKSFISKQIKELKTRNPAWTFNYVFSEYCVFLVVLGVFFAIVGPFIQDGFFYDGKDQGVLREASLVTGASIIGFLMAFGAITIGKLKYCLNSEHGNAALYMLAGAAVMTFGFLFFLLGMTIWAR
jgi:hypothetical protein